MSSKKKKKDTAENKPAAEAVKAEESVKEEDIPVQSFSDMLAFSDDDSDTAPEEKTPSEEEPVKEQEPPKQEEPAKEPKPPKQEEPPKEEEKPKPIYQQEYIQTSSARASGDAKNANTAFSSSAMPISEEEAERQAAALDALDRDLEKARMKKLQTEEFDRHRREVESKKEQERLAKAEEIRRRHENAMDAAKKQAILRSTLAEMDAPEKKKKEDPMEMAMLAAKKQQAEDTRHNRAVSSMNAGRVIVIIILVLISAYIGVHLYINRLNDGIYGDMSAKLTNKGHIVDINNYEYKMPPDAPLSAEAKKYAKLNLWLADTDGDGLSDKYETMHSATDPNDPDCDGDTVPDGVEIRAGLDPNNPMTDGVTADGQVLRDTTVSQSNVKADLKRVPKTAYLSLAKVNNNSIQGVPGIVGSAYEFYSDKTFESCELSFSYDPVQLESGGFNEGALSIFRFDADKLKFIKLESKTDFEHRTVSANTDSNGIYAMCDSSVLSANCSTNVFFLIDNSGSMYPDDLCPNSEENDVDFKRLEFSTTLMDMLGTEANYGAGQFLGTYTNICPISSDSEEVKKKINEIKNEVPSFSGTDIAGSLMSAVNEFGSVSLGDKNYIILLTDGIPTTPDPALDGQAIGLARSKGITVFTIGLGKKIDSEYLLSIAEQTNGQFFQASNADALENIYAKIESFMSYNQVIIDESSGKKGYTVADCGFNVLKDGIGYSNFRADFAPDGTSAGIAGLIRAYYTGELNLRESSYTAADGTTIQGYDISSIESFISGKTDLTDIKMDILDSYNEYLKIPEKWDYRKVSNNILQYTEKTRDYIDSHSFKVITSDYTFEPPIESDLVKFMRTITLKPVKGFTSYECILIDSSICQGDDLSIINMLKWFNYLPDTNKCKVYDFGYDGDEALNMLAAELTTGCPAVINLGGSYMNAVRLMRDADNPNIYVINAYDSNSPKRITQITLTRTPIYDGGSTPYYQYITSMGSTEYPLQLIIPR